MLKHFKDLGIKVAREHVENRQLFEQHAKGCHNRIEAAGVAICKHPDNKRMGTNYSGCFFDSCPFVMFLID